MSIEPGLKIKISASLPLGIDPFDAMAQAKEKHEKLVATLEQLGFRSIKTEARMGNVKIDDPAPTQPAPVPAAESSPQTVQSPMGT